MDTPAQTAAPAVRSVRASARDGGRADETIRTDANRIERDLVKGVLPLAAVFAIIGALPWIAESANTPARYPDVPPANLQSQIAAPQTKFSFEEIQAFGSQPEAITLQGRLLYPRTFGAKAGLTSATPWPSYAPRDYPRLGFKLLNRDVREVVFPNKGVAIKNVHAQDVIVLGCQREDYIEARLLVFPNSDLTYLSNLALTPCSQ